ncbi:hypothetical protein AB4Z17_24475 [Paenibacillus sp. TAF43_2]|uniref:hypothetical protein n=1 Tax=Paenibacillus sp. TAF43_2 TaxID=3233069 RepID=UPI003F9B1F13
MNEIGLAEIVRIRTKGKSIFYTDDYSERSYYTIYKNMAQIMYDKTPKIGNNDRKLVFGYLESDAVNASAFIYKKNDYIFINCGTIVKIHDTFNKLLSNPRVFSEVGKPKYSDYRYHYDPVINNGENQTVFFNGPTDEKRRDLAFLMSYFAILYVIQHEMGHHLNGHLQLLNESDVETLEMTEERKTLEKISILDYQTLEMDADAFATSAFTAHLHSMLENLDTFPFPALVPQLSKKNMYSYWLFSVHCLYRVLGNIKIDETNLYTSRYFPYRVRQALSSRIPISVLVHLGDKEGAELYASLIDKMFRYTEEMYNITFETQTDFSDVIVTSTDKVAEHSKNVHDNWHNIKPRLMNYARAILAD